MAVWPGTAIAGLVVIPVDSPAPENECANILRITGAKALFHPTRKQGFAGSPASQGIHVPVRVSIDGGGDCPYASFGADAGDTPLPGTIAGSDPVSIVFTSGTTGFAKGVTLSMMAGGGPLSPETADFFDSSGFNIVHGYGMSKNSPLIPVNTPWHKRNAPAGLAGYKKIADFTIRAEPFEKNTQQKIRRFLYKDYGNA